MKEMFFQFFFCIYILWQPILSAILSLVGMDLDGSIMRIALVIIVAVSLIFHILLKPRYKNENKLIVVLFIFGVVFFSTQFFYTNREATELFLGAFLRWGADCVPACLIGVGITKIHNYSLIHKILPIEALIVTPLLLITVFQGVASGLGQFVGEGGLDYQVLAYYLAFLFSISFYYTFIFSRNLSIGMRIVMLFLMLIQFVGCLMSGGRGGVVLMAVYSLYFIYLLVKVKHISLKKVTLLLITLTILIGVLSSVLGLSETAGFARSSNMLNNQDRTELWKGIWHYIEDNHYIGYGLGGDYYTFGFYTHNLFVDLMLETGIIGTILISIVFFKMIKKQIALSKCDPIYIVIMLLFLYGFVMNMFSGYWLNQASLWLVFGISIVYNNIKRFYAHF